MTLTISPYERSRFMRDTMPIEVICKYCDQVLYEPVQCMKCKYFYCFSCSKITLDTSDLKCKHEVSQTNKFLKNKIEELMIKCKFWKNGCQYSNKVAYIDKHETSCHYGSTTTTTTTSSILIQHCIKNPKAITPIKKENLTTFKYSPNSSSGISPLRINNNIANILKCDRCSYHGSFFGASSSSSNSKENGNQSHNCIEYLKNINDNKQNKIDELEEQIEFLKREKKEIKISYDEYVKSASQEIDYFSMTIRELQDELKLLRAENEYLKAQNATIPENGTYGQNMKVFQDKIEAKLNALIEDSEKRFEEFKNNFGKKFFEYIDTTKNSFLQAQTKICHELLKDIANEQSTNSSPRNMRSSNISQNSVIIKEDADGEYGQFKGIIFRSEGNELSDSNSFNEHDESCISYLSSRCKNSPSKKRDEEFILEKKKIESKMKKCTLQPSTSVGRLIDNNKNKSNPKAENSFSNIRKKIM